MNYLTINGEFNNTIIIEKSKFICYIKGIEDEKDAKFFIERIRKENSFATHNCYAYIGDDKGLIVKFSDDGEPQGTAGLPILEGLKSNNLFKVCAVVTRYFGGIKLGTGGLYKAYLNSVLECVKSSKIVENKSAVFYEIKVDYKNYDKLNNCLIKHKITVISSNFDNDVFIKIAIPKDTADIVDLLNEYLYSNYEIKNFGEGYFIFNE